MVVLDELIIVSLVVLPVLTYLGMSMVSKKYYDRGFEDGYHDGLETDDIRYGKPRGGLASGHYLRGYFNGKMKAEIEKNNQGE